MATTTLLMPAPPLRNLPEKSSPARLAFEINPFRIFRLPVNTSTNEAVLQAENALTLERVGMAPVEPDQIPWLRAPDSYEMQQAAQSIEEPLARLQKQMIWFDLERTGAPEQVRQAMRDPWSEAMTACLREEIELPTIQAGIAVDDRLVAPPPLPAASLALMAEALNQANLKLLLASARMDAAMGNTDGPHAANTRLANVKWSKAGSLGLVRDVHLMLGAAPEGADAASVDDLWNGWLRTWMRLLGHPWFHAYAEASIAALEDDFATVEDVEAVLESVRNQLLEISVQQVRYLVLAGRYPLAGAIIHALGESGMEARLLTPAMRPLRSVFQSELAELEPLLEQTDSGLMDALETYFRQLEPIAARWRQLDPTGIVGLPDLLDDAAEKGYQRLRGVEDADLRADALVVRAQKLVTARSLAERLRAFQKELEERRKNVCHYCKTIKPNWDKSVVLNGKKETGRTRSGRTTTVHYLTTKRLVPRCDQCAERHDYVRKTVQGIYLTAAVAAVALVIGFFVLPSPPPATETQTVTTPSETTSDAASTPTADSAATAPATDSTSPTDSASDDDISKLKFADLARSGDTSGACRVVFQPLTDDLSSEGEACLTKVNAAMRDTPSLKIAIVGNSATGEADELTKKRVLKVAIFLSDVKETRMKYLVGDSDGNSVETFYVVRKHDRQ